MDRASQRWKPAEARDHFRFVRKRRFSRDTTVARKTKYSVCMIAIRAGLIASVWKRRSNAPKSAGPSAPALDCHQGEITGVRVRSRPTRVQPAPLRKSWREIDSSRSGCLQCHRGRRAQLQPLAHAGYRERESHLHQWPIIRHGTPNHRSSSSATLMRVNCLLRVGTPSGAAPHFLWEHPPGTRKTDATLPRTERHATTRSC